MSDIDAEFDAIVAGLSDVEATDTEPAKCYDKMTALALSRLFNRTKQELLDRGELLHPTTPRGQDLGAIYHGALLELKKRGLA